MYEYTQLPDKYVTFTYDGKKICTIQLTADEYNELWLMTQNDLRNFVNSLI